MKGFSSKSVALKADVLKDRKIYSAQARPCIFQPGNFKGWGSEVVNMVSILRPSTFVALMDHICMSRSYVCINEQSRHIPANGLR